MARGALQWSVRHLGKIAGVSPTTIVRFENEQAAPVPATLKVIRLAFEDAGIVFVDNGVGEGVKLRRKD
jgi:DNA-binding XRE family transcriptional regulator